jgi:hypothetical protein
MNKASLRENPITFIYLFIFASTNVYYYYLCNFPFLTSYIHLLFIYLFIIIIIIIIILFVPTKFCHFSLLKQNGVILENFLLLVKIRPILRY